MSGAEPVTHKALRVARRLHAQRGRALSHNLFQKENAMSLPSIPAVAEEFGINLSSATDDEKKRVLMEAMKRDLGEGLAFLHARYHEAEKGDGIVSWKAAPNSVLGRQLIRIHAADPLRALASELCHGAHFVFVNCCDGEVATEPGKKRPLNSLIDLQLATQDGRIGTPDC